ncbi:MAG: hypothetical protein ABIX01_22885 [Chitinophagaceae bacterium]
MKKNLIHSILMLSVLLLFTNCSKKNDFSTNVKTNEITLRGTKLDGFPITILPPLILPSYGLKPVVTKYGAAAYESLYTPKGYTNLMVLILEEIARQRWRSLNFYIYLSLAGDGNWYKIPGLYDRVPYTYTWLDAPNNASCVVSRPAGAYKPVSGIKIIFMDSTVAASALVDFDYCAAVEKYFRLK